MKKVILIILLSAISSVVFAQSQNVTSAAIILKQYNSEKDKSIKTLKIKEAKEESQWDTVAQEDESWE